VPERALTPMGEPMFEARENQNLEAALCVMAFYVDLPYRCRAIGASP
jgi:hypothetical protein